MTDTSLLNFGRVCCLERICFGGLRENKLLPIFTLRGTPDSKCVFLLLLLLLLFFNSCITMGLKHIDYGCKL